MKKPKELTNFTTIALWFSKWLCFRPQNGSVPRCWLSRTVPTGPVLRGTKRKPTQSPFFVAVSGDGLGIQQLLILILRIIYESMTMFMGVYGCLWVWSLWHFWKFSGCFWVDLLRDGCFYLWLWGEADCDEVADLYRCCDQLCGSFACQSYLRLPNVATWQQKNMVRSPPK